MAPRLASRGSFYEKRWDMYIAILLCCIYSIAQLLPQVLSSKSAGDDPNLTQTSITSRSNDQLEINSNFKSITESQRSREDEGSVVENQGARSRWREVKWWNSCQNFGRAGNSDPPSKRRASSGAMRVLEKRKRVKRWIISYLSQVADVNRESLSQQALADIPISKPLSYSQATKNHDMHSSIKKTSFDTRRIGAACDHYISDRANLSLVENKTVWSGKGAATNQLAERDQLMEAKVRNITSELRALSSRISWLSEGLLVGAQELREQANELRYQLTLKRNNLLFAIPISRLRKWRKLRANPRDFASLDVEARPQSSRSSSVGWLLAELAETLHSYSAAFKQMISRGRASIQFDELNSEAIKEDDDVNDNQQQDLGIQIKDTHEASPIRSAPRDPRALLLSMQRQTIRLVCECLGVEVEANKFSQLKQTLLRLRNNKNVPGMHRQPNEESSKPVFAGTASNRGASISLYQRSFDEQQQETRSEQPLSATSKPSHDDDNDHHDYDYERLSADERLIGDLNLLYRFTQFTRRFESLVRARM